MTRRRSAADVEDLAAGAEDGGDDLGVTRQPAEDVGGEVGAVGGGGHSSGFEAVAQGLVVEGDQEPGGGGVGVGDPVGVEGVLGEGDQGVPQAGAVVAGVAESAAGSAGLPVVAACEGGCGSGEGEEGGCEEGAVLGRAAAADPDPTGPVRR